MVVPFFGAGGQAINSDASAYKSAETDSTDTSVHRPLLSTFAEAEPMEAGTSAYVRPAEEHDRQFVHTLFHQALSKHYSGDHIAHADRILDAHLKGGVDQQGHFSLLQRTFVLVDNQERIGLVHVVYKRQRTVKISPLIVSPSAQGRGGSGRALLEAAEEFTRRHGARQLYCTVAETNDSALGFFRHHGFVVAGSAFEQYKRDVREFMLYKDLAHTAGSDRLSQAVPLAVRPLTDSDVPALSVLVLSAFDRVCDGLGTDWVDALVAAYQRRHEADVNAKYKDVHVTVDERDQVCGVAATGPKKGGSIKVMPLCATSPAALSELLAWLPEHVCLDGGRMYSHQPPDSVISRVMQHHGWEVEALLPGAYSDDQCMVQWSRRVRAPSTPSLPS